MVLRILGTTLHFIPYKVFFLFPCPEKFCIIDLIDATLYPLSILKNPRWLLRWPINDNIASKGTLKRLMNVINSFLRLLISRFLSCFPKISNK